MAITVSNAGTATTVSPGATITRAFGSNVTAGTRIVVAAIKGYLDSTHTAFVAGACTKSAGTATIGAVTLDITASRQTGAPHYIDVGIWSAPVTGTGSLTMQVTDGVSVASALYWNMGSAELSSNEGALTVGTSTSANAATGAPDSGTVTPATFDAVLVGACGTDQSTNAAYAQDAAFTSIHEEPNGTTSQTGESLSRVMTSGSDAASWTSPTTFQWVAVVVAYLEPAGGGPAVPVVDTRAAQVLRPFQYAPNRR